jgi:predicted MPP superfamily phosphohydrolase
MSKSISWLHISDIHFRATDAWRDSTARDSLIDRLQKDIASGKINRPNLILCTGDIAFGDTNSQKLPAQYEDAKEFFTRIEKAVGVERKHMFAVPGNHDISRDKTNRHADQTYRQMAKSYYLHSNDINNSVANTTKEYLDSLQRLEAYRAFFEQTFPHIKLDKHVHYAHEFVLNEIEVQIIGLNSVWTCNGLEEDRDVWVGAQAQISKAKRNNSLRIGLIHHPLEWVAKSDASLLEDRMGEDIHILLHGHEHQFREHSFSGGHPVIGTGAVSAEGQLEHGVVQCELNLDSGLLIRHLYVYLPNKGAWEKSSRCDQPINFPVSSIGCYSGGSNKKNHHQKTYGDYFCRPGRLGTIGDISDYNDPVEPSAAAHNRDVEYFRHLWSDSMGPHTIEILAGDSEALHYDGASNSTRVVQKDNLDAYFLRKMVVTPKLTSTANEDENDQADAIVSFDAFRKEITESPRGNKSLSDTSKSENRVRDLVGEAGIGKTLTTLKIIDKIREHTTDEFGYTTLPIYFNLHGDRVWSENPPAKAVQITIKKIADALKAQVDPEAETDFDDPSELDEAIRKLSVKLAAGKLSPFIVFDNADRFFVENAKYRFFPEYARKRDWQLDDTFVALVDRFVSESSLGKIGASVLFVCRRYVYSHCLRISDGADPIGPIRRDHKVYQLIPHHHDELLASRTKLMAAASAAVEGKYRNSKMFQERVAHLEKRLEKLKNERFHGKHSVLRTVWDLVHQGHRSWLHFLASLPIDVGPKAEIADRLFDSPYLLLRLYMTNMQKRYTQKQGHFPNLFLNDAKVFPDSNFENVHREHIHTYWLKYLILRWMSHQQVGKHKGQASSEMVFEVFSKDFGYEEHLVRLAIGSLADPVTSKCLEIVTPDKIARHVELLKISRRGSILVDANENDNPLCFSFDYLQLMTDDYLLALPECVASKIYVDADLGHSLKSGKDYSKGSRATLQAKIPAVLAFFRVLQISFSEEMKYRNANEKVVALKIAPDFPVLQRNLLDAIARLDSHFEDFESSESMPNPRTVWKELLNNSDIDASISAYYRDPKMVSI